MPFAWKIRRVFKDRDENILGYGATRQILEEQARYMMKCNPGAYEVVERNISVPEDHRLRRFTGRGQMEPITDISSLKSGKPKLSVEGKGF